MTKLRDGSFGSTLEQLAETIAQRAESEPSTSYTAKLLSDGKERCAKKFGEEAVEAAIAGATGNKEELAAETADVLYHLLVLLEATGVSLDDVSAILSQRDGVSGLAEKAARKS